MGDTADVAGSDGATITVVIVEDHTAVAESLASALSTEKEIEIVDTVADLETGLSVIGARQPHVALVDARLPDGDGATAAPEIQTRSPDTAVVVLSGSEYPSVVVRAVRAGASGFIAKTEQLDRIVDAVRMAAQGAMLFTLEQLQAATNPGGHDARTQLTDRELEVLQLLAEGASTEELSEQLHLSVHTVRNHIRNLTAKLGVNSRVAAVAAAHERGLVSPPGAS